MLRYFGLKLFKSQSFCFNVRKVTRVTCYRNYQNLMSVFMTNTLIPFHGKETLLFSSLNSQNFVEQQRFYSKRKKGSRMNTEDEESESEDEGESDGDEGEEGSVVKNVQSLRLDSVLKAGLGISKKKIEKEFYANKIRINDEKVLKKARTIMVGDTVDIVKGSSPDNEKFILVDRINLKSVGKVTDGGNFPIHIQVFKALAIENYPQPWTKSSSDDD